jgi:hypothetical protein
MVKTLKSVNRFAQKRERQLDALQNEKIYISIRGIFFENVQKNFCSPKKN